MTGSVPQNNTFVVTNGAFQTVQGGGASTDAFVTKFSSDGSSLVYSTFLGGNNNDFGNAIATDNAGNAYLTGDSHSTNFPLQNPIQSVLGGTFDSFISQFDSSGSHLLFSTYYGGGPSSAGDEHATGINVDSSFSVVVVGNTSASDFPVVNAFQPQLNGFENAYVVNLVLSPDFTLAGIPLSATISPGQSASYTLTLNSLYGFGQSVTFTCSGAPSGASCDVSPVSVTPGSGNSASATVTVRTSARSLASMGTASGFTYGFVAASIAGPWFLLVFAPREPSNLADQRIRRIGVIALMCVLFLPSCGGGGGTTGGNGGTPPGNYTLTVTGTSGAGQGQISHSVQLNLVVN